MRKILLCLALACPIALFAAKEPPVPIRTVPPSYPANLKADGTSGVVIVKCTIDTQGSVKNTEVVKTTHPDFAAPATEALQKWKFKPAAENGSPIEMDVSIPVKFTVSS